MYSTDAIATHPTKDPLGAGYHIIQSMIAIGSGGVWGQDVSAERAELRAEFAKLKAAAQLYKASGDKKMVGIPQHGFHLFVFRWEKFE